MVVTIVVNRIFLSICIINCFVASVFLIIVLVNHHRYSSFLTLLVCNTVLGILLYSSVNFASVCYMFIWDEQVLPVVDPLCSIRAYFYHSTIAWIHHSLVLQALERYFKVRRILFFRTHTRQLGFILIQWLFDFLFGLPVLLTGNMKKLMIDNLCFVSLNALPCVFYLAGVSFILSDITLSVIYRLLVRHVREISSRLNGNRLINMQRDLTIVHRIVLLNILLVIVGFPVLIVVICVTIRADLLPNNTVRVLIMIMNIALLLMLLVLFWITPDLRQSLINIRDRIKPLLSRKNNRVHPIISNHRY
ncbi:unnamed protein product [Adineta ricciae]|uniref:G-protein coupled receptors family 1 profile domain-containing protein n=1 Tax=Adineta ricciae TaxID=249248 RepID=A0A815AI70_ADIRI|nr:unnamed protein product [Adineta ricciae]CAF1431489.1 unnamed protein product [Adineta ricciae]